MGGPFGYDQRIAEEAVMLQSLVYIVIYAICIGLVAWLLIYLVDMLSPYLPGPLPQLLRVVIIVFAVLAIIFLLLGLVDGAPRLGRL
jgi:H+/Cl- antiporter ClcA